ncbi:LOW QUALITY PROTEIN: polyhomeotic-like protein 3 [Electrophorus electricus]|uniref:LOW QUALITY PROTEIN: polyhomeotic-like protein 3 n=1 Tax=Electrophorus electricus TaxID=8005 RepID=UPI0015CF949B|nr:LOW QUALITY PROTEIN: polyhomeotic-like protein 3 [Electrophorus electricus]
MERDDSEAAPGSITTTTSSAPTGTPAPNMFVCTQANPTPLSTHFADRKAVQVIQQAIPKPANVTTQYLQQAYAAQQHRIMVQTTAVHEHQQPTALTTHSHASVHQVSQSNSGQSTSPPPASNGSAAQTSPIRQFQATRSSGSAGAIGQHTMLLGNSSSPGSQAQMYLRTQMVILAPAASVSADPPALTSVSSQPGSTQVSSLSMCTHLPGALTAAPSVHLKVTSQGQSLPKMSLCPLKSTHLSQALVETSSMFTPMQSHAVVRQQLHCTPSTKVAAPQLILQSSTAHRQVQPIALQVTPQDRGPPPLSSLTHTTPAPAALLSQHCEVLSVSTPSDQPANQSSVQQQAVVSTSTLPPSCSALLDPPSLHLGPVVEPRAQPLPLSCPPPHNMAFPRLAVPPASLQRLSLRSVHTIAMQSDNILVPDNELPGADAFVQLPFQNLSPPQTVAVDLKVQPPTQKEDPSSEAVQLLKEEEQHAEQVRGEQHTFPPKSGTPTPSTLPSLADLQTCCDSLIHSKDCTGLVEHSCLQSSRSMIQLPEEPALNSIPPSQLCAAVRSSSRLPPASLPASPEGKPSQATIRPHILTHLIEGFVIREGLEPFPVGCTSLENQQQPRLPQDKKLPANAAPACHDLLMDTEQPASNIDNITAEDERLMESLSDELQCEFCAKRGYAHSFLRSKRFCSMTCVRRFNVSCTKRLSILGDQRVKRWPNRPMSRRGRPPSHVKHNSQNHFLMQLHGSYRPDNTKQPANSVSQRGGKESEEEDSPGPMTTRLRLQADRKRSQEQGSGDICTSSTWLSDSSPTQWSVEQVCSYISSLPGCQDMVMEFRSQEIDGQALLLLTEEHLMSVMNIKLGPALKICAYINSLKEA